MLDQLTPEQVKAIFETVPMEITVIDAKDEVAGWNQHDKRLFKRPHSSMGVNFRECHPKESLHKVEQIVGEMKAGKRDKARFYIDMTVKDGSKHKILIEFFALRDETGKYLGCMECTQDVESIRAISGEQRLLQ
ncbi:MAG: PAS domain-containing protein [Spirochaetota bacterium]